MVHCQVRQGAGEPQRYVISSLGVLQGLSWACMRGPPWLHLCTFRRRQCLPFGGMCGPELCSDRLALYRLPACDVVKRSSFKPSMLYSYLPCTIARAGTLTAAQEHMHVHSCANLRSCLSTQAHRRRTRSTGRRLQQRPTCRAAHEQVRLKSPRPRTMDSKEAANQPLLRRLMCWSSAAAGGSTLSRGSSPSLPCASSSSARLATPARLERQASATCRTWT